MSRSRASLVLLIFLVADLCAAPKPAVTQEVSLVPLDNKAVAKGYRANALRLRRVMNDKGELIGSIDDFIFGREGGGVFAIIAVGDFVGEDSHLVAVPFKSLKIDDADGTVILPGASRSALLKLPVFFYNP